jgi:hypothetical protein
VNFINSEIELLSSREQSDTQLLPKLIDCFNENQDAHRVLRLTDELKDLDHVVKDKVLTS